MILYLLVAIWPLLWHEIYSHHRVGANGRAFGRTTHIILAMLPMFLMIGFRGMSMGADTGIYMNNFTYVVKNSLDAVIESTRMESGYVIFVKIIGMITQEPLVYQLICTSVYFLGVLSFAVELENDDAFLFLYFFNTLGLFLFMFTDVRQCLAMSICLFSYRYVKNNKIIGFLCCVLLAFTIHKSAILFLAVYLIRKKRISFYNIALYGVGVLLSTLYLDVIQNWFNEQFEYEYEIEETGNGVIFLCIVLLLTIFCLYIMFSCNKLNEASRALMNVNFIAVFFWFLRLGTRVAERPSFYFLFFTCAIVAFCLNRIPRGKQRLIIRMVIIACALILYFYRLKTSHATLVPYQIY